MTADRGRGRRRDVPRRDRARAHGGGHRQVAARGATGRIHGADHSLVDYNPRYIPLIEIVTKPITGTGDKAPLVAKAYVAHLRELPLASTSPTSGWSRACCAAT